MRHNKMTSLKHMNGVIWVKKKLSKIRFSIPGGKNGFFSTLQEKSNLQTKKEINNVWKI